MPETIEAKVGYGTVLFYAERITFMQFLTKDEAGGPEASLSIYFTGGKELVLEGEEAERVWRLFRSRNEPAKMTMA